MDVEYRVDVDLIELVVEELRDQGRLAHCSVANQDYLDFYRLLVLVDNRPLIIVVL